MRTRLSRTCTRTGACRRRGRRGRGRVTGRSAERRACAGVHIPVRLKPAQPTRLHLPRASHSRSPSLVPPSRNSAAVAHRVSPAKLGDALSTHLAADGATAQALLSAWMQRAETLLSDGAAVMRRQHALPTFGGVSWQCVPGSCVASLLGMC